MNGDRKINISYAKSKATTERPTSGAATQRTGHESFSSPGRNEPVDIVSFTVVNLKR